MYNARTLVRVGDVADAIERIAPLPLAEGWDNCGLQVGDPAAEVGRVLVALTPLPEVFAEAEEKGADPCVSLDQRYTNEIRLDYILSVTS